MVSGEFQLCAKPAAGDASAYMAGWGRGIQDDAPKPLCLGQLRRALKHKFTSGRIQTRVSPGKYHRTGFVC
jgi:hypothetical protein